MDERPSRSSVVGYAGCSFLSPLQLAPVALGRHHGAASLGLWHPLTHRPGPARARVGASRICAVLPRDGAAAYWDDTAPDMLSFALSGPGWTAVALALAVAGVIFVNYFEIGPRRQGRGSIFYYIRVSASQPFQVELPMGTLADIHENDVILRETKLESADAIVRTMENAASKAGVELSYTIYKANNETLVPVRKFPRPVDVPGALGWASNMFTGQGDAKNALWETYAQLGSRSSIEDDWAAVVQSRSGVASEQTSTEDSGTICRLCGGSGFHRCAKCMGASATGKVQCGTCSGGRVPCEWCSSS